MPMARRRGDPEDFDPIALREVKPELWAAELGYGKWSLKLRSLALLVFVAWAVSIASNLYIGVTVREAITSHDTKAVAYFVGLINEDSKTRCILALSLEQRQELLRDRVPGAWTRACWWIQGQ